jgi:hypothetical protein
VCAQIELRRERWSGEKVFRELITEILNERLTCSCASVYGEELKFKARRGSMGKTFLLYSIFYLN